MLLCNGSVAQVIVFQCFIGDEVHQLNEFRV